MPIFQSRYALQPATKTQHTLTGSHVCCRISSFRCRGATTAAGCSSAGVGWGGDGRAGYEPAHEAAAQPHSPCAWGTASHSGVAMLAAMQGRQLAPGNCRQAVLQEWALAPRSGRLAWLRPLSLPGCGRPGLPANGARCLRLVALQRSEGQSSGSPLSGPPAAKIQAHSSHSLACQLDAMNWCLRSTKSICLKCPAGTRKLYAALHDTSAYAGGSAGG
jgi:hypothetical protein